MQKAIMMLCCMAISFSAISCDICGNFMGITPYNNRNSISFLHRYRVFNGYRNYQQQSHFFPTSAYKVMHGTNPLDSVVIKNYSKQDFESFKIFELRLKYFVLSKLELNVFVPFTNNKSKINDVYNTHVGLGDISFNAGYHIIKPKLDKRMAHKLLAGLGIKLPTGNFYVHDKNSNRMPFEMQAGSGTYDGFCYLNYVVTSKKIGASVNLTYKMNGTNIYKEHLANSTTDFASVFYKITYKSFILFPSVQANYEFTKGLSVNKQLIKASGINTLLLGPGFDVYYKSFSLNTSWQFTVCEQIADGELKSAGRINVGINYNFSNKKTDSD